MKRMFEKTFEFKSIRSLFAEEMLCGKKSVVETSPCKRV